MLVLRLLKVPFLQNYHQQNLLQKYLQKLNHQQVIKVLLVI
uniref:Uncharacterized protein n=1 Tax=Siphoviridae sp. ctrpg19 TaxID=2826481 RepID=A0A8S5MKG1_9CAUD|nr:MAG TPA: hypothetical protein [Siphoviridae sp. ctrpg19]